MNSFIVFFAVAVATASAGVLSGLHAPIGVGAPLALASPGISIGAPAIQTLSVGPAISPLSTGLIGTRSVIGAPLGVSSLGLSGLGVNTLGVNTLGVNTLGLNTLGGGVIGTRSVLAGPALSPLALGSAW